ncbi:hypothetical protein [Paracoccus sp. PAR01]|uniref:hypothetical protein n=1 Tax=Paracoccus sp. PAR01 TaxID=2769282 RepID=UPI0017831604|nr:hypothetical protein [Paracoccus sp. PAR01]MBD9526824.1 hypothetical protein [Paracoccus sp. PAR01]
MKDDLNASEKRLIAALDRIDNFIDRTALLRSAVPDTGGGEAAAELQESRAHNQRLSDELAALRASHSSAVAGFESRLKVMNERLAEAEERAVELAAANEALASANRALVEADGPLAEDAIRRAQKAEIESLRAARQAERGKLGEIIDTLDRMLGVGPAAGHADPEPARPSDAATDADMADADAAEMSDATDEQRG